MNRRQFLKSAGAGALIPWLSGCRNRADGPDLKKNVLLICVDDLRPELGCYGRSHMVTPSLDELAAEACLFSRHYIQAPSCGPSRHSLLTGRRPQNLEQATNNAYMERNFHKRTEEKMPESFAHHFRHNGYRTVGIGKISHTPDGLVRGLENTLELPYSWDEMLCDSGKWGDGFDAFFAYASGESRASLEHQVPPFECAEVDDEGYPDGLNAALAVEKLRELNREAQPFFLAVGFFKPHLPFNSPKKYWDLYPKQGIELSANPDLPVKTPRSLLHNSGEFFNNYRKGRETGGIGTRISDEYAREIRHAYFAAVSYVDAQIGKVLDELKNLGLEQQTIVVVWGDHGWHLGDHTLWGKHSPFERSSHSPLLIKAPGYGKAGMVSRALVESLDIYPTLCELAGINPPPGLDGNSLTPVLVNPSLPGKEAAYSYWRNMISMRTDRYRLIVHSADGVRDFTLFDHQTDPNETVNIAGERLDLVRRLLPLLRRGNRDFLPDEVLY